MALTLRKSNIRKLREEAFDVLIIGGGINGAVAAASLAGRGVRTALIEREDFASGVSSSSSNLAWGGIKYLETHEYLLVNKLCRSRNQLMDAYPSTVKEIRFFTTIQRGFRFPPFFVFLGAVLYWIMGRFRTRPPAYHSARALETAEPVIDTRNAAGGLEYSDCYLYDNDARFVFNFVRKSLDFGCIAANYVESLGARRQGEQWVTEARDTVTGETFAIRSRVLVNACGPYVDQHNERTGERTEYHHLFSKGIHLIVDRVTDNRRVLTFFASDGRLFFLIPMGPKTCIGTTDTRVEDPAVGVTDEDRDFVLDNVNALLDLDPPLGRADIIAERVGVRPLATRSRQAEADWVKLSRKHVIEVDEATRHLSIFGGKLTDCLNVGDEVAEWVARLGVPVPQPRNRWYGEARRHGIGADAEYLGKIETVGRSPVVRQRRAASHSRRRPSGPGERLRHVDQGVRPPAQETAGAVAHSRRGRGARKPGGTGAGIGYSKRRSTLRVRREPSGLHGAIRGVRTVLGHGGNGKRPD